MWGPRDAKTNYVRVFMVAIRKKLEPGSGIRFDPEGM